MASDEVVSLNDGCVAEREPQKAPSMLQFIKFTEDAG